MPKTSINFQNTLIYKIEHADNSRLYFIGHTTDFTKAKNKHKNNIMKGVKGKYSGLYELMSQNGGFDNFKMIEMCKFPCSDNNEADAKAWDIRREIRSNHLKEDYLEAERKIKVGERPQMQHAIPACKQEALFTCNCGAVFQPDGQNKHVGTKRHLKYEASKIN